MRETIKTLSGTVETMKNNFKKELEKQGFEPENLIDNGGKPFVGWSLSKETKVPKVAPERHQGARYFDCRFEGVEYCDKCGFTK